MTPSLNVKQSNLDACSSRRPCAVDSSARGPRALSRRSSSRPLRAPGRPCAIGSSARVGRGLCSARIPQLVVALYAPPDVPARSAVQRAWAGVFVQREFRSWLWPFTRPRTPLRGRQFSARAPGFVPAQFRSWQRPLAAASEDCLSTGQSPGPFLAATPTVPSQRCGPSCSPSPRGNGGRTRGHGSRSARAQQSPGQSRPGRRSWRGCW